MAVAAMAMILGTGCVQRIDRKTGPTLQTVDLGAPFLKAHMRNGDLYVLSAWRIDEATRTISGTGELQGPERQDVAERVHRVHIDDVALFETNTVVTSPGVAALAVVTGISVAVTVACLTNPKACFGSCPTFYAVADDGRTVLQAEGFSDAISPSLERNDVDALWHTTGRGGRATVRMTNEAYETHVVKQADLLAVRRPPGGRVIATEDRLWLATAVHAPRACTGPEGSCLDRLRAIDSDERTSLTDAHDLAARETIELEFAPLPMGAPAAAPGAGPAAGIVIASRQSLVTTFLIYQGLAYLGTTAGTWLAALERGVLGAQGSGRALQQLVGSIEVQVERAGAWHTIGETSETGPLATDVHLVPLPAGVLRADAPTRIRLVLPQGGWRIDHVGLATLAGEAQPTRIAPTRIRGTLGAEYGKGRVAATRFPIVTLPGDAYDFEYVLPPGDDHELFLDSRGYYLEWMRREWMREERPAAALQMLVNPAQALRDLAPLYKQHEPTAEAQFWGSRYAHP